MPVFIPFITGIIIFYSYLYFPLISGLSLLTIVISINFFLTNRGQAGEAHKLLRSFPIVKKPVKAFIVVLSFLAIGIIYALLRYEELPRDLPQTFRLKGVFSSLPVKRNNYVRQMFTITSSGEFLGIEITTYPQISYTPGTKAEVLIEIFKTSMRMNPGASTMQAGLSGRIREIYSLSSSDSVVWVHQRLRYQLSNFFENTFNKDISGFLNAVIIGYRGGLSDEIREVFNNTGLAHLLSISGTHFGLFSLIVFGICRLIIHALPYRTLLKITLYLTPSELAAILTIPVITIYLMFSGMRIPAMRSFIMINIFLWGILLGRKGAWLNSLFFAAFIIAIIQPDAMFSISFLLSFAAVLFIGLSVSRIDNNKVEEKTLFIRILEYPKNMLIITVAAYAGTLPVIIYEFNTLSLISPVANLIVVPLLCFIILPITIATSIIYLLTGILPFTEPVSRMFETLITIVQLLEKIPFSSITIPTFPLIIVPLVYLILFSLSIKKNDREKQNNIPAVNDVSTTQKRQTSATGNIRIIVSLIAFSAIFIILLITHVMKNRSIKVTFLDAGQGDSSVVELPKGKIVVIDTGSSGREAANYLEYIGKTTIDALILSHAGNDHAGGLGYLLKRFDVRRLWDNGAINYAENILNLLKEKGVDLKHLKRGDIIRLSKEASMSVLHPYPGFSPINRNEASQDNNFSLVMSLKGRYGTYLFTGDIEREAEYDLLILDGYLRADVLKVAHHGGKTSSTEAFLASVNPEFAVISVGAGNNFNHPDKGVIDRLRGRRLYRTDRQGAVGFEETINGLFVKKYSDYKLKKADSFDAEWKNMKRLFMIW